jgi:hypothetical protein
MRIDAIATGKNPPEDVNVIIEVPIGGEPIKYEMDKEAGALAFYAGAGGRDVAEGVEVFDQKALRKVAFVWD